MKVTGLKQDGNFKEMIVEGHVSESKGFELIHALCNYLEAKRYCEIYKKDLLVRLNDYCDFESEEEENRY